MSGPLRSLADRVADADQLPTAVRAVLGHYAAGGDLELDALRLQRRVEAEVEAIVDDAYEDVEAALAAEFGRESVDFSYDTKLTMPVELTLGHVYRRADAVTPSDVDPVAGTRARGPVGRLRRRLTGTAASATTREVEAVVREVRRAEDLAELVVVALLDGDMRDAINDDEYGDFEVDFQLGERDRERVAEIAQAELEAAVQSGFARYDDPVREAYDAAVDRSEAHQDRDPYFRRLMAAARGESTEAVEAPDGATPGDEAADLEAAEARQALREEYRDADFTDRPELFESRDADLPYLVTQYGRVGVIYHGMVEMFREGGVDLSTAFERAVVLAIVGAQVWLDDVDDFEADMREGQLTPVTAEYLLAEDDATAHERVVSLTNRYLDRARESADASDAPITGIAVEYIRHDGDPEKLPR